MTIQIPPAESKGFDFETFFTGLMDTPFPNLVSISLKTKHFLYICRRGFPWHPSCIEIPLNPPLKKGGLGGFSSNNPIVLTDKSFYGRADRGVELSLRWRGRCA
ncbi:MAG: hypothetical protein A3I75_04225 [Deltaproteobacteria bacterium RIFCSPLOWO2_02_FULL_50_16]|nr:MAG: hypothetical protein A3I75_04225 [Deltaproteobacteria bacterium RIFCSPLOWO2_02_FULL_50_16]OGQ65925.1 MAG: hypothetical protein A3F89_03200 [Deltaproteobacteria bacterium RIFCSPLOWO2_12_FULL_50_11]